MASNWLPDRDIPATTDRLIFNTTRTISNVPLQTVGRITIDAGITVTFTTTNPANILTISNTTAPAFVINGVLNSGINITLNTNVDAPIAGTLIIDEERTYVTGGGNSVTTVTGIMENRGTVNSSETGGQNGSLVFANGGTYIHSQDGGIVPEASWDANSNCAITGVVSTMPTGFDQRFGNFEWNSVNQAPVLDRKSVV